MSTPEPDGIDDGRDEVVDNGGVSTQCFTCHGNGMVYRHVASRHGSTAVTVQCLQCHGNRFLPGLDAPL